jgi:hypothetical protein
MPTTFPGPVLHVVWKLGDEPTRTQYLFARSRESTDAPDVVEITGTGLGVSMRGSLVVIGHDVHGLPTHVFNHFFSPVNLRVGGQVLRVVIVPREGDRQSWIDAFDTSASAPAEA